MSLNNNTIQQALRVKRAVTEYFEKNQSVSKIAAKDLMPFFVSEGIFNMDYDRPGLPIRNLLRELDENDELHLIPQVHAERKTVRTYWFFVR